MLVFIRVELEHITQYLGQYYAKTNIVFLKIWHIEFNYQESKQVPSNYVRKKKEK